MLKLIWYIKVTFHAILMFAGMMLSAFWETLKDSLRIKR
jgi:hypothetical protein